MMGFMTGIAPRQQQLEVLSWICFCGPGLFNALTSLASGLDDPRVAFAGNALIYSCFAAFSLLAATVVTSVGVRAALTIGSMGYFAYALSLYNLHGDGIAPLEVYYVACVLLGISAGFLWTAQGLMMLSYPRVETQGKSVSRFWIIFNMGATTGGVISFILNFRQSPGDGSARASNGMFVVFLVLMGLGVALAVCLVENSDKVLHCNAQNAETTANRAMKAIQSAGHDDRTASDARTSWRAGLHAVWRVVSNRAHRNILLCLLPLFAYSNWFYTYHSFYNIAVFNPRTSGLASSCYWLAQMGGAFVSGRFLDKQLNRNDHRLIELQLPPHTNMLRARSRQAIWHTAKHFLLAFFVLANGMWAVGWYVQATWLHSGYDTKLDVDFWVPSSSQVPFLPCLLLFIVYGLHDALCQVWIYWFMSMIAEKDALASGCYAGTYKSIQAASAACAWYLGAIQVDPLTQLQINVFLCNASILCALLCCEVGLRTARTSMLGSAARDLECHELNALLLHQLNPSRAATFAADTTPTPNSAKNTSPKNYSSC